MPKSKFQGDIGTSSRDIIADTRTNLNHDTGAGLLARVAQEGGERLANTAANIGKIAKQNQERADRVKAIAAVTETQGKLNSILWENQKAQDGPMGPMGGPYEALMNRKGMNAENLLGAYDAEHESIAQSAIEQHGLKGKALEHFMKEMDSFSNRSRLTLMKHEHDQLSQAELKAEEFLLENGIENVMRTTGDDQAHIDALEVAKNRIDSMFANRIEGGMPESQAQAMREKEIRAMNYARLQGYLQGEDWGMAQDTVNSFKAQGFSDNEIQAAQELVDEGRFDAIAYSIAESYAENPEAGLREIERQFDDIEDRGRATTALISRVKLENSFKAQRIENQQASIIDDLIAAESVADKRRVLDDIPPNVQRDLRMAGRYKLLEDIANDGEGYTPQQMEIAIQKTLMYAEAGIEKAIDKGEDPIEILERYKSAIEWKKRFFLFAIERDPESFPTSYTHSVMSRLDSTLTNLTAYAESHDAAALEAEANGDPKKEFIKGIAVTMNEILYDEYYKYIEKPELLAVAKAIGLEGSEADRIARVRSIISRQAPMVFSKGDVAMLMELQKTQPNEYDNLLRDVVRGYANRMRMSGKKFQLEAEARQTVQNILRATSVSRTLALLVAGDIEDSINSSLSEEEIERRSFAAGAIQREAGFVTDEILESESFFTREEGESVSDAYINQLTQGFLRHLRTGIPNPNDPDEVVYYEQLLSSINILDEEELPIEVNLLRNGIKFNRENEPGVQSKQEQDIRVIQSRIIPSP